MELIDYQFVWKDWWKLWPSWHLDKEDEIGPGYSVAYWYFFFGPLQTRWYYK